MDLTDQELCVALEERIMFDVSDLFLSLLGNRLDRTIIRAAVELGVMRFAVFVRSLLQARKLCLKFHRGVSQWIQSKQDFSF